jgi:hypothetical protein
MLVRDGREAYVPMGAMCETRPGIGLGTPYFEDSSQKLRDSMTKFDFVGGGLPSLDVVLREARDKDTYTLWHLIQRVGHEQRIKVLKRMIRLVGLPEGVTLEGIMSLNQDMLELWKEELDPIWFQ